MDDNKKQKAWHIFYLCFYSLASLFLGILIGELIHG